MMEDLQFVNRPANLCLPPRPSALFQRQRRASSSLIGITLVLLILIMAGVIGSASASPEAKALLQAKACGACHVIPGVDGAYGKAGPSLKGLHERRRIVGGTLENNPDNLKVWLKDPKSMKPGSFMPDAGLTDEEVEILILYFDTI